MGRIKRAAEWDYAAPLRRFLWYIFGNLAFDPNFDTALEYFDAAAFASAATTCLERPWHLEDRNGPLKKLVSRHSHSDYFGLLKDINERFEYPESQDKLRIHRTHLSLDADWGRYPTFDELRFWVWYGTTDHCRQEPSRHFVFDRVPADYKAAFESNERRWTTALPNIPDPSLFRRRVKAMGLRLAPGKLIAKYRSCYNSLKKNHRGLPTVEAFVAELIRQVAPTASTLEEASLADLVDYLASPLSPCHSARWRNFNELASLDQRMQMDNIESETRMRAIALLEGLARLDIAFEVDRLSPLFDGIENHDKSPTLRREIRRIAKLKVHYPSIGSLLHEIDDSVISTISADLQLTDRQFSMLRTLAETVKRRMPAERNETISALSEEIPELGLIQSLCSMQYKLRYAGILWTELSAQKSFL
jgi:hypothetical protein